MTFEEYWMDCTHNPTHYAEISIAFKAGAASRDAEVKELLAALQMAFDYAIRGKTFPANAQTTALLNAVEIELAKVRKP